MKGSQQNTDHTAAGCFFHTSPVSTKQSYIAYNSPSDNCQQLVEWLWMEPVV